jgi:hypothetical protein
LGAIVVCLVCWVRFGVSWEVDRFSIGLDEFVIDLHDSESARPCAIQRIYTCRLLVSVKEGKPKTPQ